MNGDGARGDLNGPRVAQGDGRAVGVDVVEPAEAPLGNGLSQRESGESPLFARTERKQQAAS